MADDPALQARLAAAALLRVRSIGGWETYGDVWEGLLQRLIQGVEPGAALPSPTDRTSDPRASGYTS